MTLCMCDMCTDNKMYTGMLEMTDSEFNDRFVDKYDEEESFPKKNFGTNKQ